MEIVSENHTHQDNSQITGGIDSPIHERPLPTLFTRTGYFILALIPVVAIFCSGARQAWSLSLTAGLMGISMLLISPVKKVPWVIWLPTSVAMLVGLSFALNIESLPPWRANLLSEFGVHTGTLQSPHPWISLERWLLGVLVILWLWFVISLGTREKDKRFILQVLTLGLSAVIACALYSKFAIVSPSHWQFDNGARFQFGPFPNRNHFSGVCAISGILSFVCVYDSIRRKTWTWPLFVLCLIVSFSAIILNTSRFGVLMFFFGCGTWMFSAALQDRSARKLAIFGSILLTGTTFILIFGQGILARFLKEGDLINTLANDGRSSIYQRTIEVLTETPWHGWSIGTFSQVFSLLDPNPNPHTRISHPESDLLWLAFEYGLPATILILVGIAFLVATFGPLKIRKERQSLTERGIRNAAAISALALLAQGVVDVPLHMLGIGVLAALLAGLGSNGHQKKRSLKIGDKRKTSKRFFWHYAAALYCFSCCYIWGSVHYGKPLFPTDTFARKLMSETIALAEKGHDAEALKHIEQVIDIRPLHWDAYFHRASIKLSLGYPHQQVLSDFSKARILEKNNVNVPFTEASIWENHNPQFALAAYSESMRRDPTQSLTYFHHIMNLVNRHPSLRYAAKSIARTNPKLHHSYLMMTDAKEFQSELDVLLSTYPKLQSINDNDKLSLFRMWYDKADRTKLLSMLNDQPQWMAVGWSVVARHHAQNGDFRSACKLGFEKITPPISTPPSANVDIDQLTRLFLLSPTDISRGLQLYESLKFKERDDEALRVLDDLAKLPSVPNKVLYEKAFILNRKKEYSKSWDALQQYMNALE